MSPKLGTKHARMKGAEMKWIQFCSNEGPKPFLRVDDNQIAKIHWLYLRIQEYLGQFQWNPQHKASSDEGDSTLNK